MKVSPQHTEVYHDGNMIGRYGRNLQSSGRGAVFVWYHDGIPSFDEPAWAMDSDVEFKISVSVDVLLVADARTHAVWAIDREEFKKQITELDDREQYLARASDSFVRKVGEPNTILNGNLWIESGNQIDEGYHVKRNEA